MEIDNVQVKLRPLACEALTALLRAVEPRDAAARVSVVTEDFKLGFESAGSIFAVCAGFATGL